MKAMWAIVLLAAGLGACTGSDQNIAESTGVSPTAGGGVTFVKLTDAQLAILNAGVREMAGAGSTADPGAKAYVKNSGGGTHVCGYVRLTSGAGGAASVLPYYIELREADGKTVAERGQVGTDASKLSKVKFMCRYVEG